jgi:hypothetical protein
VESDATLNQATSNVNSVTWTGTRYEIDLDRNYNSNRYASSIQLTNIYNPEYSARVAAANNNPVVYIFDGNGDEVQDDFHFVIHDP